MIVKVLTGRHLEFLTGGCTGSSESTHVKMPHCWKSHVTAQIEYFLFAAILASILIFTIILGTSFFEALQIYVFYSRI